MTQLYINDQLVDLSEDSPMALSFQINNLGEVKNQQGNTSNQFKLPLTQRNRQILGFADEVAFTTNLPYSQYQAKVVQDGLEVIPAGIGEMNSIDQNFASITILSGNVDFFDAIDTKIYDMGDSNYAIGLLKAWQPYDHYWTLQNVVNSQKKTEGWIWPVVDYGKIPLDFTGTPTIDVRYLRPGFFLKTAIELMATAAGYTIDPHCFLVNDPLYNKLIVQFANDSLDHGSDYQNQLNPHSLIATTGTQLNVSHVPITDNGGAIPFSSIISDPQHQFSGTTFTATDVFTADIKVSIPSLRFEGWVSTDHPSALNIYLIINGGIATQASLSFDGIFERISGNGGKIRGYRDFKNIQLSATLQFTAGQQVSVAYEFLGDRPAYFTLGADASLTITPTDKKVLYGQSVQCERIFPDIGQKDLLKDTLQRFGIICQTDNVNRVITFASFRDIFNNIPRCKDWTSKCLNQGKTINFQLGNYAQVNYMKYRTDDNVLPLTLGQSQINVADQTLPATADLFQSQFAPTLNRPYIGGYIAQINKVDPSGDGTDFNISTQPRILINELLPLSGQTIRFTDGGINADIFVNDYIAVPYFDKQGGSQSLLFEQLRLQYYPELEKILHQSKKVVRYFLLSPRDILELDLLIPIYLQQDSAYYYINKIDSWRKGQPTKVELVKLA